MRQNMKMKDKMLTLENFMQTWCVCVSLFDPMLLTEYQLVYTLHSQQTPKLYMHDTCHSIFSSHSLHKPPFSFFLIPQIVFFFLFMHAIKLTHGKHNHPFALSLCSMPWTCHNYGFL